MDRESFSGALHAGSMSMASGILRRMLRRVSPLSGRKAGKIGLTYAEVRARAACAPMALERLEDRQLLSTAVFANSVLTISGNTNTANRIVVGLNSTGTSVSALHNGSTTWVSLASLSSIRVFCGGVGDFVSIDPTLKVSTFVQGGQGNDTIQGGANNDTISGSGGNDSVDAGAGNDTLYGGAGNDLLNGGLGNDRIDGGLGTNIVISTATGGTDTLFNATVSNSTTTPTTPATPTTTPTTPPPSYSTAASPQPAIQFISTTVTAGNAIHAQALTSTLGVGTSLNARYQWDFGDSNGVDNKLDGFNAAHVYDNAGTYTVTLTITNQAGKQASKTAQVTISADNRRTIYVDAQGNDANSGLSSSAPVRSVDRAMQLLGDNTRLLFQRGDTFPVTRGMAIPFQNVLIGAYGTGNRPTLIYTGSEGTATTLSFFAARDIMVQDLSFDSWGSSYTTAASSVYLRGTNLAVRRCEFLNASDALNLNSNPTGVLIQDNTAPLTGMSRTSGRGVHNYFAWVQGTNVVILGNTVAASGVHNVRIAANYNRVLLAQNTLTNSNGASSLKVHNGQYAYIANNQLTSSLDVEIGPLGGVDGLTETDYKTQRTSWTVLENNKVTGGAAVQISHRTEHLMIRNNILHRDGKPAISIDNYSSTYQAGVLDVSILNNTGINNDTQGDFLWVCGDLQSNGSAQITLDNNLYVAPNLVTGSYQTAAVYVYASDLRSFREIKGNVWAAPKPLAYAQGGYFYVWSTWSNAQGYKTPAEWDAYSVVANEKYENVSLNSSFAPAGGSLTSTADHAVAGVFTDMYGKVRSSTGTWSAGAVQI